MTGIGLILMVAASPTGIVLIMHPESIVKPSLNLLHLPVPSKPKIDSTSSPFCPTLVKQLFPTKNARPEILPRLATVVGGCSKLSTIVHNSDVSFSVASQKAKAGSSGKFKAKLIAACDATSPNGALHAEHVDRLDLVELNEVCAFRTEVHHATQSANVIATGQ